MYDTHQLEPDICDLFEMEYRRLLEEQASQAGGIVPQHLVEPHTRQRLAQDLARLLRQCYDQSIRDLEPAIRQVLENHEFIDQAGDSAMQPEESEHVELHVQVALRVMRCVRQRVLRKGEWSTMPTTPIMYG